MRPEESVERFGEASAAGYITTHITPPQVMVQFEGN
jgi:hypothetical protein